MIPTSGPESPGPPQTSPQAAVGFLLSLLGLMCCLPFFGGGVGILISWRARRRIAASQGQLKGEALAAWGIVLGLGGLALNSVMTYQIVDYALYARRLEAKAAARVAALVEQYNRGEAGAGYGLLSEAGRGRVTMDQFKKKFDDTRALYGTVSAHALVWYARDAARKDRIVVDFRFELTGQRGPFMGAFLMSRTEAEQDWTLDAVEFLPRDRK